MGLSVTQMLTVLSYITDVILAIVTNVFVNRSTDMMVSDADVSMPLLLSLLGCFIIIIINIMC